MLTWDIALSDWISWLKSLPSESIHCFVTSPPYWSLRDYQVKGQLGLEKTPEEYIARMVEGFREVRRVLRPDGTLWVNMGDSYSNDTKWGGQSGGKNAHSANGGYQGQRTRRDKDCDPKRGPAAPGQPMQQGNSGLKPKDLVGMPWRVAFALQSDGWYLRAQCPWIKRNSMPESVTDRPVTATETIFLLSKSQRYFYDAEAVKMPAAEPDRKRNDRIGGANGHMVRHSPGGIMEGSATRGRRNHDWFMDSWEGLLTDDEGDPLAFIVNPAPFSEAHFATFPPALVEPCIKAGTSEKGCCAACGSPWERIMEVLKPATKTPSGWHQAEDRKEGREANSAYNGKHSLVPERTAGKRVLEAMKKNREAGGDHDNPYPQKITIGWSPTCECNVGDPIPCTVADCFSGAGTTCLVSVRLGRSFKGSELNPDYREMSIRRVREDAPLFNLQTHAAVPRETEQLVLPQPALLPLPDDTAS